MIFFSIDGCLAVRCSLFDSVVVYITFGVRVVVVLRCWRFRVIKFLLIVMAVSIIFVTHIYLSIDEGPALVHNITTPVLQRTYYPYHISTL
jgi:hypothetical protein